MSPLARDREVPRFAWIGFLALCAAIYAWRGVVVPWGFLGRSSGDVRHFFAAAQHLARGEALYPEGIALQTPLVPVLFLPLVPLGFAGARLVWFLLSHLALLGAAVLVAKWAGGDRAAIAAVALVWALAGTLSENLGLGQLQPILLLLLALALVSFSARPSLAATAVGLAGAIKLFPALLFVAFLRRRRRALLIGGAVLVGGLLIPGLAQREQLAAGGAPPVSRYWLGTPAFLNFSLPAAVLRSTYPEAFADRVPGEWLAGNNPRNFDLANWREALSGAAAAAVLLVGLALIARRSRSGEVNGVQAGLSALFEARRELLALNCLALLASPISWYHYQLLQFPALALLVAESMRGRRWLRLIGLTALALALTSTNRLIGFGVGTEIPSSGRFLLAAGWLVPCAGTVLFWILLAREPGRFEVQGQSTPTP